VLRGFAVFGFCAVALVTACRVSATAATEFCPARLVDIGTKSSDRGAARQHYQLEAFSGRVVEGTIVADTDAGWFTWTQQPVQLTRTTYTSLSVGHGFDPSWMKVTFHEADSPELTVVFPKPVTVRHAWMTKVRTQGDRIFNWDAQGTVTCEPPDFAPSKFLNAGTATITRTPQPGDEAPAQPPPPANAVASAAPFTIASCAQPFVVAAVPGAMQPQFPAMLSDQGVSGTAVSLIAVAVDSHGKLIDAWIWGTSGYPAMDDEAIKAARHSSYTGAISYCRPVGGTYLFQAEFGP
jgi:Gram-negative bacterial TonB protein C-terminal